MKKSQDIISSARLFYQKRLSLVISDLAPKDKSKRDVYLVDTPEFKKRHHIFKRPSQPKPHQLLQTPMSVPIPAPVQTQTKAQIPVLSIASPFQIQSHIGRCQSMKQKQVKNKKMQKRMISPRTNQEIAPTSKPKAIIPVDQLIGNRNFSLNLFTSPRQNTDRQHHNSGRREIMTERRNVNINNILQSPLKRLSNTKDKVRMNYQINKISQALSKCKESLENIFPQKSTHKYLVSQRTQKRNGSIMGNQEWNYYNTELILPKKYLHSARR